MTDFTFNLNKKTPDKKLIASIRNFLGPTGSSIIVGAEINSQGVSCLAFSSFNISSCFSILIEIIEKLQAVDGSLGYYNLAPIVDKTFNIMGLTKYSKIYQNEDAEYRKSKDIIFQMVNKGIKISSIIVRATPVMEILTGFMIAGFIFFSGSLISSGELQVNQFFSFLAAMMLAYQPVRSLACLLYTSDAADE